MAKELGLSYRDVDEMPLRYFYNYVSGLERMLEEQKKALERMKH